MLLLVLSWIMLLWVRVVLIVLMLVGILLVHIRLLILELDQSTIGVLMTRMHIVMLLLLLHMVHRILLAPFLFLLRRRSHENLHRHILSGHILRILLILLDLMRNFGSHIFEIIWKRTARSVPILRKLPVPGLLGVVLLANLLSFGGPWRRMLQDYIGDSSAATLLMKLLSTSISLEILLTIDFLLSNVSILAKLAIRGVIAAILTMLSVFVQHLLLSNVFFVADIHDHWMLIILMDACWSVMLTLV